MNDDGIELQCENEDCARYFEVESLTRDSERCSYCGYERAVPDDLPDRDTSPSSSSAPASSGGQGHGQQSVTVDTDDGSIRIDVHIHIHTPGDSG